MHHGKIAGVILGAIVIIFALWDTMVSMWILIAVGVIIIIHAFMCKCCSEGVCDESEDMQKAGNGTKSAKIDMKAAANQKKK